MSWSAVSGLERDPCAEPASSAGSAFLHHQPRRRRDRPRARHPRPSRRDPQPAIRYGSLTRCPASGLTQASPGPGRSGATWWSSAAGPDRGRGGADRPRCDVGW